MKKTLILLTILMFLTSCSAKKTWDDVKQDFSKAKEEVDTTAEKIESYSAQNYKEFLSQIDNYVSEIEFNQDDSNQEKLLKAYKAAEYISVFASFFDGNCAQQLLSLATNVNDLTVALYNGDKTTFTNLKNTIQTQISETKTWAEDQWSSIEKKSKIMWSDIESKINDIENNAKENINNFNEVTEYELDELKHLIIDNYELIKDGITEDTNQIAQNMYDAAVKLDIYVSEINNQEFDKIKTFAQHALSYVKSCYGKILDDSEKLQESFKNDVDNARKWTQSTWNQFTIELKKLYQ